MPLLQTTKASIIHPVYCLQPLMQIKSFNLMLYMGYMCYFNFDLQMKRWGHVG